jgi:hypothetical protein
MDQIQPSVSATIIQGIPDEFTTVFQRMLWYITVIEDQEDGIAAANETVTTCTRDIGWFYSKAEEEGLDMEALKTIIRDRQLDNSLPR